MTQQEVRLGHPYFMYDAIMRQPQAMEEMLRKHASQVQPVAAELARKKRVHLVGIGTSWHAALIAHHWFKKFARAALSVEVWHSFEFCSYPPALDGDDAVIVISHRGTKTYSFLALETAKSRGAYTAAITSTDPGPRITVADAQFTTVEQERSSAFTVSYTSALMVLAMLAAALGSWTDESRDVAHLRAQLEEAPVAASQVLARQVEVQQAVRRFQSRERFICAGWGPNIGNAYEVALKIKETSTCDSEGLQIEQLLHGPFCSVDEKCLVTLISPPGPGYERALECDPSGRRGGRAGLGTGADRRRPAVGPHDAELRSAGGPGVLEPVGLRPAATALHLLPVRGPRRTPGPVPAEQSQAGGGPASLRAVVNTAAPASQADRGHNLRALGVEKCPPTQQRSS